MMLDKASVRHGILAARDALTHDERLVKSSSIWLKLTEQAEYIGVPVEGPYKPEHYRY